MWKIRGVINHPIKNGEKLLWESKGENHICQNSEILKYIRSKKKIYNTYGFVCGSGENTLK